MKERNKRDEESMDEDTEMEPYQPAAQTGTPSQRDPRLNKNRKISKTPRRSERLSKQTT